MTRQRRAEEDGTVEDQTMEFVGATEGVDGYVGMLAAEESLGEEVACNGRLTRRAQTRASLWREIE